MVISHKNKYLFVELPRTGTVGISAELCKNYDGELIYDKHTQYKKFYADASKEERKYFVFSCIRNPMDRTVSLYFHLNKTLESLENRIKNEKKPLKLLKYKISYLYFKKRHDDVNKNNLDFSSYFLKYYKTPYVDWSLFNHKDFNYVIRFEELQVDFKKVVELLGMKYKGPLPLQNKTKGKDKDFYTYYNKEARQRALKVFGPFMNKWGYSFPENWGEYNPSFFNEFIFKIKILLLKLFHTVS